MIGNITNALNFELKSACLKQAQITELEQQLQHTRMRSDEAISESEKTMIQTRQELENAADRKVRRFKELTEELEKVNKDLLQKAEALRK